MEPTETIQVPSANELERQRLLLKAQDQQLGFQRAQKLNMEMTGFFSAVSTVANTLAATAVAGFFVNMIFYINSLK
jgi:hypothetical protein